MANHDVIKECAVFVQVLEEAEGEPVSKKEILKHLKQLGGAYINNKKESVDKRFERLKKVLRKEYKIPIEHDESKKGYYYINGNANPNVGKLLKMAEIKEIAEMMGEVVKNPTELLRHLQFEHNGSYKGLKNIRPLLKAIIDRQQVAFDYFSFQSGKTITVSANPYFLREYQGRWYLIGKPSWSKDCRGFGLERISNLCLKEEQFDNSELNEALAHYDYIIGLFDNGRLTEVKFKTNKEQAHYFRTLPFHQSQTEEPDGEDIIFTLLVKPNYELTQKLLMHHGYIKVLQPKELVEDIRNRLRLAIAQYEE